MNQEISKYFLAILFLKFETKYFLFYFKLSHIFTLAKKTICAEVQSINISFALAWLISWSISNTVIVICILFNKFKRQEMCKHFQIFYEVGLLSDHIIGSGFLNFLDLVLIWINRFNRNPGQVLA